ncbi:hypothetical protein F4820DRAFT_428415 [Hypoxylon rubiginosum]|uniref:Uncharacterized protein n=1 Tax=Hypoxylon rubiginosum TaxID=110542 RepID=A0ACB9YWC6_9PEZI|nr:hypothetical protein F4820DRAFT_428415 [Hypoxylon rubiginosum]
MTLTEQDNISIAQIVVFVPSLVIATALAIRHGFTRGSAFFYLIAFSLARIIGASFQLATVSDPTNINLHVGAAILQNLGLSPLILVLLSFIGHTLGSIRESATAFVTERRLRLVHILVAVGLVLAAIGGSNSSSSLREGGTYTVSGLTQAGIGLLIAAYILLVLTTIIVATQVSYVRPGEKRLLLAVGLSLPFILVRLAYSAESAYGHNSSFNQISGNPNIQLGMAVIMEMIVVAICEGVGITLRKLPKTQNASSSAAAGYQQPGRHTEEDHELGGYK